MQTTSPGSGMVRGACLLVVGGKPQVVLHLAHVSARALAALAMASATLTGPNPVDLASGEGPASASEVGQNPVDTLPRSRDQRDQFL